MMHFVLYATANDLDELDNGVTVYSYENEAPLQFFRDGHEYDRVEISDDRRTASYVLRVPSYPVPRAPLTAFDGEVFSARIAQIQRYLGMSNTRYNTALLMDYAGDDDFDPPDGEGR